jgi:hypothetical protein
VAILEAIPISSPVIRITITAEAFQAIAATLPLGSVAVEPQRALDGSVHI